MELPRDYDAWRLAGPHDDEPDCPDCNGGWLVECPDCHGHGCDECLGTGEVPCPTCCDEDDPTDGGYDDAEAERMANWKGQL